MKNSPPCFVYIRWAPLYWHDIRAAALRAGDLWQVKSINNHIRFVLHCFFLPLTSNIKCTEYQNLNVSRLVLHVSLSNLLKPGITSRMKMLLEQLMFTCMHACVYFCVYALICVDACMYMCTLMFITRDSQVILFSPCGFVCVWLSMFVTMFVRTI